MDNRIAPFQETIYCQLVAYREEPDGYVIYVFRNLIEGDYHMVTKLPNWELPFIRIGDKGFMQYMEAVAGEDTWYDSVKGKNIPYRYDGSYMVNFVHERT